MSFAESKMVLYSVCALGVLVMLFSPSVTADDNWPRFRGPGSSGVTDQDGLPEEWDTKTNVVWRTDIPGRAWSSPIVWRDRVFLTSAIKEEGELEAVKPGLYLFGERPAPTEPHRWVVYCIDVASGKIAWERTAHRGVPKHGCHLKNSLASETPVTDGERVYAYFGNVGLFCYDFDGNLLWKRSWGEFATRLGWGTAASPVVHENRVYLVNDNHENSYLVALDKTTGEEVWRVDRDEKSNWATPFVWQNGLRTEIVTPGAVKIRSYDLDGRPLWELGGMSKITVPTPFASDELLYVTSGYVMDRSKPLFAIRPGASGDISLADDETANQYIAWCQKKAGPYNTSPILYDGRVYVLYDRGIMACYNAKTGEEIYGKTRIGSAREFTSSPWAYQGKIFCLSEAGQTFVIQAADEFTVLDTNDLDELCMATPAIAAGSLFIRTESKLYRIGRAE
jgi:outer membrane protein assembly factor BamB